MNNATGKLFGGILLVGGTMAIWMWPAAKPPAETAEPIRPIRSVVISDASHMPDLRFSGKVKAGADCKLTFKQQGRIQRIAVVKGQDVKKGDKIAWLLPDDFRNNLEMARSQVDRDRLTCERIQNAAKRNAVSREEVSKAEAQLKRSQAEFELAQRNLDETVLYAPYDAVVADVPASELDMSSLGKPVVVLLNLSLIKVDVAVPESIVLMEPRRRYNSDAIATVTFDSLASESFPVTFVEYKSTAEVENQTFTATYQLPAPKNLAILPGMSATITIPGSAYQLADSEKGAAEVPESALGVDVDGSYFVWVMEEKGNDGVYTVHKRKVGKCSHVSGIVRVASGLKVGERVATAGVTMLTEGREVTLLNR